MTDVVVVGDGAGARDADGLRGAAAAFGVAGRLPRSRCAFASWLARLAFSFVATSSFASRRLRWSLPACTAAISSRVFALSRDTSADFSAAEHASRYDVEPSIGGLALVMSCRRGVSGGVGRMALRVDEIRAASAEWRRRRAAIEHAVAVALSNANNAKS